MRKTPVVSFAHLGDFPRNHLDTPAAHTADVRRDYELAPAIRRRNRCPSTAEGRAHTGQLFENSNHHTPTKLFHRRALALRADAKLWQSRAGVQNPGGEF
jgi:hypothetical protein